jgi:uncharacterized protein
VTLDFPWQIDGRGRTASTGPDGHIRDLVEQVLFTAPGERVMRPDFGAGLLQLVFEPGGMTVAATTQYLVQGALERTLSDLITLDSVEVDAVDSALVVTVSYVVNRTQTREVASFSTPGGVG